MTTKEQAKMRRLEIENKNLRAAVEKHMRIYLEQLYEAVDMKTKLEIIESAIRGDE